MLNSLLYDSVGNLSRIATDLKLSQALFARLQQLAIVAGDVLLGKQKLQKVVLARLTEVIVIWLSNEQEFWVVLEDGSVPLKSSGLQQVLEFYYYCDTCRSKNDFLILIQVFVFHPQTHCRNNHQS